MIAWEFAIHTPDGEFEMAYDEYVGQHIAVWTDRADAEFRVKQIQSAGYRFNDTNLIGAKLVARQVGMWQTPPSVAVAP
jgi:hypothetical protein